MAVQPSGQLCLCVLSSHEPPTWELNSGESLAAFQQHAENRVQGWVQKMAELGGGYHHPGHRPAMASV